MIDYLFKINPNICGGQRGKRVVIFGLEPIQKKLFHVLLQQNVRIDNFCKRDGQDTVMEKLFGKTIITLQELQAEYRDAYVIVSMGTAKRDIEVLRERGIENIIVENITLSEGGIWIEGDLD